MDRVRPVKIFREGQIKNSVKIGLIGKKMYIVRLDRNEDGKIKMRIHTFKYEDCDYIEECDESIVDDMFNQMIFY